MKKLFAVFALGLVAAFGLRWYRQLSEGSEPADEYLRDPAHEFGTSTAGIEEMRTNHPTG